MRNRVWLCGAIGIFLFSSFYLASAQEPGFQGSIAGNLRNKVVYSQQEGFKTVNALQIIIPLYRNVDSCFLNYSLIGSSYDSELPHLPSLPGFEDFLDRAKQPYFSILRVGIKEKLPGLAEPVSIEFGNLNITYSPYMAYFQGTNRGIAFDNLKWKKLGVAAYLSWDPNPPAGNKVKNYPALNWGTQLTTSLGAFSGKLVFTQHYDANFGLLPGESQKVIASFADYRGCLDDQAALVDFAYDFGRNIKLNFLNAVQQRRTLTTTFQTAGAYKTNLEFPFKDYKLNLGFRSFEPDFWPRMRSILPKYLHDLEQMQQWSPMTQFRNQRGLELGLRGTIFDLPLQLNWDRFRYLSMAESNYRDDVRLNLRGEYNFNLLASYDEQKEPWRYLELAVTKRLYRGRLGIFNGEFKYIQDHWYFDEHAGRDEYYNVIPSGPNHNLSPSEKKGLGGAILEGSLQGRFSRGLLSGLNLGIGLQRASAKNYLFVNGSWTLFNSIQLDFGYRNTTDGYGGGRYVYWYDEYNRLHYPGTFLRAKTIFQF